MKRWRIATLFLVVIVSVGCAFYAIHYSGNEEETAISSDKDFLLYSQTLEHYRMIVKERLSDEFEL